MNINVARDWDEHRAYVPRNGALKGEHTKQYCVFVNGLDAQTNTLWIQGCRADGTHVHSECVRIPLEDVEELLLAIRHQLAGPLGKLAITNDLTTTVMENDA